MQWYFRCRPRMARHATTIYRFQFGAVTVYSFDRDAGLGRCPQG